MQYIGDEIKINIFKCVKYPLNLTLSCRNWSVIIKNPHAKSEWLIVNYGKAHAIRLGSTFIDIAACQTLIGREVLRYFTQKLIQLKIGCNLDRIDAKRIYAFQQKIKLLYTSNLPVSVFIYLLNERYKQLLSNETLTSSKGNDVHAISQSPHVINNIQEGNILKYIENLILNKRPIPLPRKPNGSHFDLNNDPKQFKDDYLFRQGRFSRKSRSVIVFALFGNNFEIPIAQYPRNIIQRRHSQFRRQRIINRIHQGYRRSALINNVDTLNRIANLPQQFTNDPLMQQFFNGSLFI
ncbi:hypothetical protein RclHR1_07970007 [Rhizophagus clarus]|uniref:Uncharacterized protein n=1 Tax=Rhizophagus clarus TaxID=94130 RepID=A0A2Z6SAL6_9GLOM|nr:hypothetical protein RclHR1_07970007 [Rhizophagus clarus]GES98176.1 hypothetical protein GLOIN_2v1761143 [Rhizophagus clarus]